MRFTIENDRRNSVGGTVSCDGDVALIHFGNSLIGVTVDTDGVPTLSVWHDERDEEPDHVIKLPLAGQVKEASGG